MEVNYNASIDIDRLTYQFIVILAVLQKLMRIEDSEEQEAIYAATPDRAVTN